MTAYTIYLSDKKCRCQNPSTRTEGITLDDTDLSITICEACFGITRIVELGYVYDRTEDFEPRIIYQKKLKNG